MVMPSSENITKASSENIIVLGARIVLRVYSEYKVRSNALKSAFMIILLPTLCAGTRCKLAQLRNFLPNVQSVYYI